MLINALVTFLEDLVSKKHFSFVWWSPFSDSKKSKWCHRAIRIRGGAGAAMFHSSYPPTPPPDFGINRSPIAPYDIFYFCLLSLNAQRFSDLSMALFYIFILQWHDIAKKSKRMNKGNLQKLKTKGRYFL